MPVARNSTSFFILTNFARTNLHFCLLTQHHWTWLNMYAPIFLFSVSRKLLTSLYGFAYHFKPCASIELVPFQFWQTFLWQERKLLHTSHVIPNTKGFNNRLTGVTVCSAENLVLGHPCIGQGINRSQPCCAVRRAVYKKSLIKIYKKLK